MIPIPFPEMTEGLFDVPGLVAFGAEIDALAERLVCSVKTTATTVGQAAAPTASAALYLLRQGSVGAAQLRYCFDGVCWIDTVLCTDEVEKFKLLRIRTACL